MQRPSDMQSTMTRGNPRGFGRTPYPVSGAIESGFVEGLVGSANNSSPASGTGAS